jgi:folate-binding protein YgfZ
MTPMTLAATSNTPLATTPGVTGSSPHPQLNALLHGAAVASLDQTGWIRVTGSDRVRWLNGMATNSVQDLAPGTGTYNFFLNAQGRIQGDGNIFATADELFIETSRQQISALIPYLDHYIIMDDVELADISDARHGLTVLGPQASALLAQLGIVTGGLNELEIRILSWNSATLTLIRAHGPFIPRFEVWAERAEDILHLQRALEEAGAVPCLPQELNWLRILEGTSLYGTDSRDRDLPQETNQTRALHFNKGCYLGQEIVERIRSRGNVHRTFTSFLLEGALPEPGAVLESAGKPVGELTSIAAIPLPGSYGPSLQRALGYIRREALERQEPIQYPGGTAHPATSPFSTAEIESSAPSI